MELKTAKSKELMKFIIDDIGSRHKINSGNSSGK